MSSATISAIPESPASMPYTHESRSCAARPAPLSNQKRRLETAKSTANWAQSAAMSSSAPASRGSVPATANTAAGPIANHELPSVSSKRLGGALPARTRNRPEAATATNAAIGPTATGTANSIGTNASCVATV